MALPHSPRRRAELNSPEDIPKRREEWSSPEESPRRRNELSSSEDTTTPRRRKELSSPEDTPRRRKESSSPEEDTPLCSVPPLPPSRLDLGEDVDEFQGKTKKSLHVTYNRTCTIKPLLRWILRKKTYNCQCFGSALVLVRIRIQLCNSTRIQLFYLNVNPDPDPGSQTNVDPDSGQTCRHKKLDFDMKNILYVGNLS